MIHSITTAMLSCESTRLFVMSDPQQILSDDQLIVQATTAVETAQIPKELVWKKIKPETGFWVSCQLGNDKMLAQRDAR
jgi:hypothetical protein